MTENSIDRALSRTDDFGRSESGLWAHGSEGSDADMSLGAISNEPVNRRTDTTPVGLDPSEQAAAQVDVFAGALLCTGLVGAIVVPALMCLYGVGMSGQEYSVVSDTANAAVLSLVMSLVIVRRLLTFPLLRSVTFIVITFASASLTVGALLKLFKINFSSPQFFLVAAMSAAAVEVFLVLRRRRTRPLFAVLPTVEDLDIAELAQLRRGKCHPLRRVPRDITRFNAIIADLRHDLAPEWERFLALAALRGIPVFHVKQFRETLSGRVAVDHLWENTVVGSLPALVYPQLKRLVDLITAIAVLPVVLPIIAVAGLAIRMESPGPALFRQDRTGYGGRKFRIFKLRTMTADAPQTGTAFTQRQDPRVTRLGAILRQYRIDELPQVFNIILGHMSWIGPRPEAVELAEWYEKEIPFYAYRHIVRPGITGWAQVNQGNVGQIDAARLKLEYDFFYIKHYSVFLDGIIVVKTIRTIITRAGAH